jgi:hypothetical protein
MKISPKVTKLQTNIPESKKSVDEETDQEVPETDAEDNENFENSNSYHQNTDFFAHEILNDGLDYENSILHVLKVRKKKVNELIYIILCVLTCGLFFLIDYWRHFKWRVSHFRLLL